jgi:hypothetical protein
MCSKPIDKSTLIPIYGQAREAEGVDVPPPPMAHREAPPPEPERPREGFYAGGPHFQFGIFGGAFEIGFGNGGIQFHPMRHRHIMALILALICLALTLFGQAAW